MTDVPEITYIELDDPAPRWYKWAGAVCAIIVLALLATPFLLDPVPTEDVQANDVPLSASDFQTSTNICRPAVDFPAFAQPALEAAMPSWMRVCEWFSENDDGTQNDLLPEPVDGLPDAGPTR